MFQSLVATARFLTVEQWRLIDRQYPREQTLDLKVCWICIAIVLALIVNRYYCKSTFILGIPAAKAFFAAQPYPDLYPKLYWALSKTLSFVLIPVLTIRYALKVPVHGFGLHLEKSPRVLLVYLILFAAVFIPVALVSNTPAFLTQYPLYKQAGQALGPFVVWELSYGYQFFCLEFFFRGFMLFALVRYLGHAAIFVMTIPYTMIHFTKPMPETLGAVIAGIALGTLALRTRSIYGGVLIHCAVAWCMDLLVLFHKGQLRTLFTG